MCLRHRKWQDVIFWYSPCFGAFLVWKWSRVLAFCWGRPWILTQWSRKWRKKKTNFQLSALQRGGFKHCSFNSARKACWQFHWPTPGLAFHFLVHPQKRVPDSLRFSTWHRTDFLNLCAFVTFVKLSLPKLFCQFSFGVLSRLQYFQAQWQGVHSH